MKEVLLQWFINFLIKDFWWSNCYTTYEQLAEELHKPIIRKLTRRKAYLLFKDNIWGFDLAHMQSISKFNKEFRFSLCVIDISSKYAWVVPLKNKKDVTIVNVF